MQNESPDAPWCSCGADRSHRTINEAWVYDGKFEQEVRGFESCRSCGHTRPEAVVVFIDGDLDPDLDLSVELPWRCELCSIWISWDPDPCLNNGCVWCEECGPCDHACEQHRDQRQSWALTHLPRLATFVTRAASDLSSADEKARSELTRTLNDYCCDFGSLAWKCPEELADAAEQVETDLNMAATAVGNGGGGSAAKRLEELGVAIRSLVAAFD